MRHAETGAGKEMEEGLLLVEVDECLMDTEMEAGLNQVQMEPNGRIGVMMKESLQKEAEMTVVIQCVIEKHWPN